MIQRLLDGLRALVDAPHDAHAAADCADAIRLELDCMQQELTPAQRAALRRLLDSIDGGVSPDDLRHAAVDASSALGVL
jgi:hypothetical protein